MLFKSLAFDLSIKTSSSSLEWSSEQPSVVECSQGTRRPAAAGRTMAVVLLAGSAGRAGARGFAVGVVVGLGWWWRAGVARRRLCRRRACARTILSIWRRK
eukprot:gene20861-biopygen2611